MKHACVIGDPVSHSRSPLVHGFWLAELGIEGSYGRERVSSDALAGFITGLRERGYRGCNVTLPHKEAAFRLVDATTELSRQLAAVNTVWFDEDGRLHGDNTDVHGFVANLDQEMPGWRMTTSTALVLGAGGAARAAVFGLKERGAEVFILNRTVEAGQKLARQAKARTVKRADLKKLSFDVIINATPVGMKNPKESPLQESEINAKIVFEMIYDPAETQLMKLARARGAQVIPGIEMFVQQAARQFEIWTGKPAPWDDMLRAVTISMQDRNASHNGR